MKRIVVINGLINTFHKRLTGRFDKWYIPYHKVNFTCINTEKPLDIKYTNMQSHIFKDIIFDGYTNDIENAQQAFEISCHEFNPYHVNSYVSYGPFVIYNYFKKDYDMKIIDLDSYLINYNKNMSATSQENLDELMTLAKQKIKEEVNKNDIVFFSLMQRPQVMEHCTYYNYLLLDYISTITTDIYIGGNSGQYTSAYHDISSRWPIVRGMNLENFKFNGQSQYINHWVYTPNSETYMFDEKIEQPSHYNYVNDLFTNSGIPEDASPKFNDKFIKCFIYSLELSRECREKCAFCDFTSKNSKPDKTKITKALDGLKSFTDNGYNAVCFTDCAITSKYLFDMYCNYIQQHNIKLYSYAGVRVRDVDADIAQGMRECNIVIANLGVESINKEVLRVINKKINIDTLPDKLNLLHKNDIFINTNFIISMPYAIENESQYVYDYCSNLGDGVINSIIINALHLYPNAPLASHPHEHEIKTMQIKNKIFYSEDNRLNSFGAVLEKKCRDMADFANVIDKVHNVDYHYQVVYALYDMFKTKEEVWKRYKKIYEKHIQENKIVRDICISN